MRICKKCLYKDMGEAEYNEMIAKNLEILSQEDRASSRLYEERLDVCRLCEKLNAGTCNLCGCYVEIRAALKRASCPHKKW